MILTTPFYIVIAVLACIAAVYIYIKNTERHYRSIRSLIACVLLAPVAVVYLFMGISKNIIVVEDSHQSSSDFTYQTYEAFGHPKIKLQDGTIVNTRDMELGLFSNTILNASGKNLLVYPVVYGNNEGLASSFKRAENKKTPDPIYIPADCYDKVKRVPDFWFINPPSSIEESEHVLVSLWHGIVGKATVKWCVIEYNIDSESE